MAPPKDPGGKGKRTSEGGAAAACTKQPDPAASRGQLKREGSSSSPLPEPKKSKGRDVVPLQALDDSAASQAKGPSPGTVGKPLCPPSIDDAENAVVAENLAKILPHVKTSLRQWLKNDKDFALQFRDQPVYMHAPLDIKSKASMSEHEMASYKPPWDVQQAKTSVQSTGMYEAAGNLLWLNPVPPTDGDEQIIAGDPLYWPTVKEAANRYFGTHADQRGHPPAASQGKIARLMFPSVLHVHVESLDEVERAAFHTNLRLLSGHLQVAAWYWAVYCAIEDGDRGRIATSNQRGELRRRGKLGLRRAGSMWVLAWRSEGRPLAWRR